MNITANNPDRKSWVTVEAKSDFPIQNIPFGIYSDAQNSKRACIAIGANVLDLSYLSEAGLLDDLDMDHGVFEIPLLNPLMEYGKQGLRALRNRLADLLDANNQELQSNPELVSNALKAQSDVELHLPIHVGDYTDFYSSIEHATNVGTMFRDPANALMPNWKHIPVGYHGRSSSIISSGVPIHRPKGQTRPNPEEPPVFGPCRLLDFELETAFVTFDGKPLGQRISTSEADEYIFGMMVFNDWSARDIQKWEYVPLGPFLAKNFASSLSPWIVTLDALEPFRVAGPAQAPEVLTYLKYEGDKNIDIKLQVAIQPEGSSEQVVSNSNFKYMYWNLNQQLAHHTVNGCNIKSGDLMGSGTISGKDPSSYGSMLELSWQGTKPMAMPDGSERKFLQDGDTVIMRGHCEKDGIRVGFGEVSTKILPAVD